MLYNFDDKYPLWKTTESNLKLGQIIVDDTIVQTYPDNDGGVWYYHPKTKRRVQIS